MRILRIIGYVFISYAMENRVKNFSFQQDKRANHFQFNIRLDIDEMHLGELKTGDERKTKIRTENVIVAQV